MWEELVIPITTLLTRWIPPMITFGGPSQRAKANEPGHSFWHLSVSMRPMTFRFVGKHRLEECEIFMDLYDGNRITDKIQLMFGDAYSEKPIDAIAMTYGKSVFVPIAFRSEQGNDQNAYVATKRYFNKGIKDKPLSPDRTKNLFRLRLKSRCFTKVSPHFYLIRVPNERSNAQFSVEQVIFGEGTQGLEDGAR